MQSFIRGFIEEVQAEKDFEKAKSMTLIAIEAAPIQAHDKKKMQMIVRYQIHSQPRLVVYLYNSLSVFEGFGLH